MMMLSGRTPSRLKSSAQVLVPLISTVSGSWVLVMVMKPLASTETPVS